jgi:hypothetical protein
VIENTISIAVPAFTPIDPKDPADPSGSSGGGGGGGCVWFAQKKPRFHGAFFFVCFIY